MTRVRSITDNGLAADVRWLLEWTKGASRRMDTVGVRLYAAAIAYRTIFSVVAFMSTFVLIGYLLGIDAEDVGARHVVSNAGDLDLETIAKQKAAETLQMGTQSIVAAGVIGLFLGLYGMSGGFAAVCDVLDRTHGTHRYVRMSVRYLRGGGVACVFLVLAGTAVALLMLTQSLGHFVLGSLGLKHLDGFVSFVVSVVVPCITLLAAFIFVNRYGSHARPPWPQVFVSACVAALSAVLLFFGFAAFLALAQPFKGYGALASTAGFLIFGYMQAYILILSNLFGPEILLVVSYVPGLGKLANYRSPILGTSGDIDA